jgi:hypothetical protein
MWDFLLHWSNTLHGYGFTQPMQLMLLCLMLLLVVCVAVTPREVSK